MWQEIRDYGRQMTTLTSGDLSSLSQLFFDNLSTILAALYFTQELKHSGVSSSAMNNILLRRITPGIGLSLCLGNTYHSYMAVRLAKQWKRPYTAQPFGINSLAAFTMVSNVMCESVQSIVLKLEELKQ
jgi:AGZA family xanthine/uracil permease-like MFS transporter